MRKWWWLLAVLLLGAAVAVVWPSAPESVPNTSTSEKDPLPSFDEVPVTVSADDAQQGLSLSARWLSALPARRRSR